MEDNKIVNIITKIGLAGIALVALLILYLVITNNLMNIGNYIQENTRVLTEVRESISNFNSQSLKLEATINELNDIIKYSKSVGLKIN